jgi:hypothetical protein
MVDFRVNRPEAGQWMVWRPSRSGAAATLLASLSAITDSEQSPPRSTIDFIRISMLYTRGSYNSMANFWIMPRTAPAKERSIFLIRQTASGDPYHLTSVMGVVSNPQFSPMELECYSSVAIETGGRCALPL